MMAPINDGTIAIPAILGPQEPNNAWPSADPTKPAPDQQTRKQNRADKLEKKGNDNKNNVRHIDWATCAGLE